jgi:oxalate decarboxylase
MDKHHFRLIDSKSRKMGLGGERIDVREAQFPVLAGMSLSLLTLVPKGFREPHWHPNAHELSYCLEGKALMTIFSPGNNHDTFTIHPGEMAFVPMGSLHHIENISDKPLKMLVCFDQAAPEDLELSSSINAMPANALGATFCQDPQFFSLLKSAKQQPFAGLLKQSTAPALPNIPDRYKLNLEGLHPQVDNPGGWVKLSNSSLLPTLEGLALYSLHLHPQGVREPHWHPNAHELNYLIKGRALITLLSPDGSLEQFEMSEGMVSFLPRGYLHHIEAIGDESAHFAVFFNHKNPSDIGISGALGAYSNELLTALFGVPASYFDKMPKYQEDLFVVPGKRLSTS